MSASLPTADITKSLIDFRFVLKAEINEICLALNQIEQ